MEHTSPFGGPKTCDWCEHPATKSAGADGTFIPRFHLCALHASAPALLEALKEIVSLSGPSRGVMSEVPTAAIDDARAAIEAAK